MKKYLQRKGTDDEFEAIQALESLHSVYMAEYMLSSLSICWGKTGSLPVNTSKISENKLLPANFGFIFSLKMREVVSFFNFCL